MVHKAPLQLLIILLGFSLVLSSAAAVPATRRLLSNREESSTQTTLVQGAPEFRNGEEMFDMGKELIEGRMDLESAADYPGTGANNRHDPKTPGRA